MAKVVGRGLDPLDLDIQNEVESRQCLQEVVLVTSLSLMLMDRRLSELRGCRWCLWVWGKYEGAHSGCHLLLSCVMRCLDVGRRVPVTTFGVYLSCCVGWFPCCML